MSWVAAAVVGSALIGSNDASKNRKAAKDSTKRDLTTTKYLDLGEEELAAIMKDILGSQQGLAEIFNVDKVAGLYNTTASKQAAGNLVTNLAGELAKLTAKEVTTEKGIAGGSAGASGAGAYDTLGNLTAGVNLYTSLDKALTP